MSGLAELERLYLRLWVKSGLILLVAAGAILAGQCFFWLKDGVWYAFSTKDLLYTFAVTPPPVSLRGMQNVIEWALWLPATIVLLGAAWVFGWIAMKIEDAHFRKEFEMGKQITQRFDY
jgi:hypothetical protein